MDLKQGALNYRPPVDFSGLQSQIDALVASGQADAVDYTPTNGQTLTPPPSSRDLLLINLTPAADLALLTITLPSSAASKLGQRVFVRSSRAIAECDMVCSDCTIDNWVVTFNPGDSVVYIKSKSTIWSRVT